MQETPCAGNILCRKHLVLVGDFNVHNQGWLRFSNGMSTPGSALYDVSATNGWEQCVKGPTRYEYLIDLVLTDLASFTSVIVLPALADPDMVLATFDTSVSRSEPVKRQVWDFNKADWKSINKILPDTNWN